MTNVITLSGLHAAIVDQLKGIPLFKQVQAEDGLTESVPETPMIQVFLKELETSRNSGNDRITFKSPSTPVIRQRGYVFNVDVYARQRSNIGTDMEKLNEVADEVIDVLESQQEKPLFGLPGIRAFSYTAERVTFQYGRTKYTGIRFDLDFTVF